VGYGCKYDLVSRCGSLAKRLGYVDGLQLARCELGEEFDGCEAGDGQLLRCKPARRLRPSGDITLRLWGH